MGQHYSQTKRSGHSKPVQIMERDVVLLRSLLRFVVLDTNQLHALCGGGFASFRLRLRKLFDAGYIARPPIQFALSRASGRRPMIYTLGKEGADYLRVVCGDEVPSSNYERNAQERQGFIGQHKLAHDLGANGVVIALEQALLGLEGVTVYTPQEVLSHAPDWTRNATRPFSIPTRFLWQNGSVHERSVIPDGVIAYRDTRLEKPVSAMLFVEFDQQMDISRSDPRQSSILQKVASYSAMFRDQTVKARFGFDAFRVLFITTGHQKRLDGMIEACVKYRREVVSKVPPYPFYFSTEEAFQAADSPLGKFWRDGDGKAQRVARLQ